jgi:hypothetical protein
MAIPGWLRKNFAHRVGGYGVSLRRASQRAGPPEQDEERKTRGPPTGAPGYLARDPEILPIFTKILPGFQPEIPLRALRIRGY